MWWVRLSSSTGTDTMRSISRCTASVEPTQKTSCREIMFFWNSGGGGGTPMDRGRRSWNGPHTDGCVYRPRRGDPTDHGLGRGPRDGRAVFQRVGAGMNVKMAKAKTKRAGIPKVVPKFSSEAEEAAWWDAHRSEIESEIRHRMKQKRPLRLANLVHGTKSLQPITLRIAKEDLESAREQAARKGLGYQTYIKMLLREALTKNGAR